MMKIFRLILISNQPFQGQLSQITGTDLDLYPIEAYRLSYISENHLGNILRRYHNKSLKKKATYHKALVPPRAMYKQHTSNLKILAFLI